MATREAEGAIRRGEVLIIDDDPDIRRSMRAALLDEGYTVREARDGQSGLESIRDHSPDLVLLDLNMPVMSGWDVLVALRESGSRVPVVIMTAGNQARLEAERHGTAGYLAKPFDLDMMYATLDQLLRRPPAA